MPGRATVVLSLAASPACSAWAQTSTTMSGPPAQVVPYAPEPGVPLITINPGTPNPFAGGTDPVGTASTATDGVASAGTGVPAVSAGVGATTVGATSLPNVQGPTSGSVAVSGSGTSLTYTNPDGTTTTLTGGTMAWRDNNPGNIIAGPFATSQGAIGSNNGFAVFPDVATGTAALTTLLDGSSYQTLSVDAAIAKYAPPSQNNTASYQATVENQLGVSGSTPLSSLSSSQMQALQAAIQQVEGYSAGSVTSQRA